MIVRSKDNYSKSSSICCWICCPTRWQSQRSEIVVKALTIGTRVFTA